MFAREFISLSTQTKRIKMYASNASLVQHLMLLTLTLFCHLPNGSTRITGGSIKTNRTLLRSFQANRNTLGELSPAGRFSFGSFFHLDPIPYQFGPGTRSLGCGQRVKRFTDRIVGGRRTSINHFPWMVSLQREKGNWYGMKSLYHSCGGSLITRSWIVTASHCLYNRNEPMRLVAGTDNLNLLNLAQIRGVSRQIVHPQFNISTYDNDIALVKADQPFHLDSGAYLAQVGTVCLSPDVPILTYDIGTICGFGARSFQAKTRAHLYETQVAIVERRTCEQSFEGAVTRNMICAGGMISNRRDACSGDSGGPLTLDLDTSGRQVLAGVVSFGQDCARAHFPGIYTNVQLYYKWILDNIDEPLEAV